MSDFNESNLNKIQKTLLQLVTDGIDYSKNVCSIVAPAGFADPKGIRDYCRIAVTMPQRAGSSVFAQFLSEHLSQKYPDANIIRLAGEELCYGESIDPRIDFITVKTPADYGRARRQIRDSEKKYNFVIVDSYEWVCGLDNRLEKLSVDMYRTGDADQYIIGL